MNITDKSAYRWCLIMFKLAPLIILFIVLGSKSMTLTEYMAYMPDFSFTDTLVTWFTNMGINLGVIGEFVCGYFNYLVMFHLVECLFEVVVFLPHLFINFCKKMYD